MTKHPKSNHDEAESLVREAVQELRQGEAEEARFILEEARRLDPDVVEEVVHDTAIRQTGIPGIKPAQSH